MTRDDGLYVLYPIYFDSKVARPLRRVSRAFAVPSPTAEHVARACAKLRLEPVLETGKHHPARWHKTEGRVLVPVRGSKAVLVRQVAQELFSMRQSDAGAGTAAPQRARPSARTKTASRRKK